MPNRAAERTIYARGCLFNFLELSKSLNLAYRTVWCPSDLLKSLVGGTGDRRMAGLDRSYIEVSVETNHHSH
jgi:hypothetical protein